MSKSQTADLNNPATQELIESHHTFNDRNLVRVLRLLNRHVNFEINLQLEKKGHLDLRARHLSIFENLDFKGTNIVTLARRSGISKQAMSKSVKEVSALNYISVVADRKDARVLIVTFTAKGLDFIKDMRNEYTNIRENIYQNAALTAEQGTQTFNGIKALLTYFEKSHGEILNDDKQ